MIADYLYLPMNLQPHLDELLALKEKLRAVTGAPPPVPKEEKKKVDKAKGPGGKSSESKVVDAPKVGVPPDPPILAPAYTSPAPAPRASTIFNLQPSKLSISVWSIDEKGDDVVDMTILEVHLQDYSYVGGYFPSKEDIIVLKSLYERSTGLPFDLNSARAWTIDVPLKDYNNCSRWLRNIVCTDEADWAHWK